MAVGDELARLAELHSTGALSDEEYAAAKNRVLNSLAAGSGGGEYSVEQQEASTRMWAMLLHLSILAGYVAFVIGLVAPIIIWQMKKNDLPGIDQHGKNAANWILSELIYAVICVLLSLVLIGIPLLIGLAVVAVVFPIIAAVKANNGEVWRYPVSITFFK